MKNYEKVVKSVTCDLCKEEFNAKNWGRDGDCKTRVSYQSGWVTRDNCGGTEYSVDVCPECFMQKLGPWLNSQGAVLREKGYGS